jgi:hypothetical protein
MRNLPKAGLAVLLAAGVAGTGLAASRSTHVMTVPLGDGSVARVEYVGDVPPKVTVTPMAFPGLGVPAAIPTLPGLFEQMDRQMAAAMHEMDQLSRQPLAGGPAGASLASYGSLPPGTSSYSMVTVSENGRQCSRSTQVVGQGPGKPPKVLSNVSGDCAPAAHGQSPAPVPTGPIHQE